MPERHLAPPRRIATWLLLWMVLGLASAQAFTGTYDGASASGPVELELRLSGEELAGTLLAPGTRVELQGFVDGGVGAGLASNDQLYLGFEAHLEGDTLGLYLFEMHPNGDPVMESVVELIFTRRSGAGGAAGAATAFPPTAAAGQPWVGTFADDRLRITIEATASGGFRGVVRLGDQAFGLDAVASSAGLIGGFESGGQRYTFDAHLEGDVLLFRTDGYAYRLARVDAAGSESPVIARGEYGALSRDDALAFLDILEFVLQQIGYPYQAGADEREQALEAMARSYPNGVQVDQVVLAHSRQIWQNVQANWARTSSAEQREFVLGVLILAYGESTVQQWVGTGGGGGGGGAAGAGSGCTTFEDCTSRFVDEKTWTDTFQAQGCWAAAGCESYDAGSGTLTFDSFNYD